MDRTQFIEQAINGYDSLAKQLAEYQADPEAYEEKWRWQIIANPTSTYSELTTYGGATPDSIRNYAEQLGKDAGKLYDFAQTVPSLSWRQRLWYMFKYACLAVYYRMRCDLTYNLGPGTVGPFHPAPNLCASKKYQEADRQYSNARVRWRLLHGHSLEETIW